MGKNNKMKVSTTLVNDVKKLSILNGISSFEENIVEYIKKGLENNDKLTFDRDNLGSLAVIKSGTSDKSKSPTISFTAHMDEVGFMITNITKAGFIKFTPIGGWWGHVVLGKLLTVTNSKGEEIIGVVGSKAPHSLSQAESKVVVKVSNMYLDIGAKSDRDVKNKGISVGNMLTPTNFEVVDALNDRIISKAHDNRVSVAIGMEIMRKLLEVKHDSDVIFIGSTQEEVGLRGAKTSSYKWTPDIAFAIDVTITSDTPGSEETDTKLGSGVALSMFDASVIANKKLFNYVESIAKKYEIPYVYDGLLMGGTDAGQIHLTKEGVITMTISVPSRYIHSHNSMVDLKDLQATVDLIVKFIIDFNSDALESIKFK